MTAAPVITEAGGSATARITHPARPTIGMMRGGWPSARTEGPGGGVRDGVVDEHPERGEPDRAANVDGRGEDHDDCTDCKFGAMRYGEARVPGPGCRRPTARRSRRNPGGKPSGCALSRSQQDGAGFVHAWSGGPDLLQVTGETVVVATRVMNEGFLGEVPKQLANQRGGCAVVQ